MSISRRLGRKPTALAGVVVVALLATTGIAYAVGTAMSTTVIHGCYKTVAPNTLSLRTAATCPAGTTALAWNKPGPQGIQGLRGIQGVQGVQGQPGDPGSPGLTGFETVSADYAVPAGGAAAEDVACPPGKTAISGGWSVPYTATVLLSSPSPVDAGVWRTTASFPTISGTLHITVQCAVVPAAPAEGAHR